MYMIYVQYIYASHDLQHQIWNRKVACDTFNLKCTSNNHENFVAGARLTAGYLFPVMHYLDMQRCPFQYILCIEMDKPAI